ncbi:ABC transporter ATP-binding protein [Halomontanus rarus]|uniref:ABC transporter ATP-binding protein n=1 Tax=Halomontanus rarus TaxID=3034020 RepID=UPI00293BA6FD|nr:ABC transporter ATP-binding protein [Halovivax sp. KZCA124]
MEGNVASEPPKERFATVTDPVVEVRNCSVTFDMSRGVSRVLDDVSLDIERGEILGVVGESGSGKSMFASALLDAVVEPGQLTGDITYHPDKGEPVDTLSLSDEELRRIRWEEIAMVFQGAQSSFNPTMTIRGHFEETLEAHDRDIEDGIEYTKQLLQDLYLDPERVLSSYPHELSGGMKQRTLIALSLLLDPEVLVMDEPTAALDLLMQRSILGLLEEIKEKYDLTVVFITHDLPLVAGLCDRIAVLYAFEFVELGTADSIIEEPAHPYTRSLLRAVPNLDSPISEMHPIEGGAPDPVNVPSGCSYHPRCPLATEECSELEPEFEPVHDEHHVSCFHYEEAPSTIPLELNADDEAELDTSFDRSTDEPVVSLDDVDVHFDVSSGIGPFGDRSTVQAVDDVSLDIYENDVVALVGESGCGKTTLGKTAIGAQRPTDGAVVYRGQDVWDAREYRGDVTIEYEEIRQALQIIHQDPGNALNAHRKVQKILEVPLKQAQSGMSRMERLSRIFGLLEHVGMNPPKDYAERYPHQLSGGEKQRVALIRALLMNPDVILADEAVSALDVSLRVEMMDLMLELQEIFGTSYVFISHNLSNARYLTGKANGRIGVMYLGNLVEIGPPEEIIRNPKHPYTKVLKWSTTDLEVDQSAEEPPIRGIDIPDPANPPSGCRFHTRCPEARETCRKQNPDLISEDNDNHRAACFREFDDHEYWDSDSIVEESNRAAGDESDRTNAEEVTSD